MSLSDIQILIWKLLVSTRRFRENWCS